MWRENFGLDKTIVERFEQYLHDYNDWEDFKASYGTGFYHKIFAEFQILRGESLPRNSHVLRADCFESRLSWIEYAEMQEVFLKHHSTTIHTNKLVFIDNGKTVIVHPDYTDFQDNSGNTYLLYFVWKNSFEHILSEFFMKKDGCERTWCQTVFCNNVDDFSVKGKFVFIIEKQNDIDKIKQELIKDSKKMDEIKKFFLRWEIV